MIGLILIGVSWLLLRIQGRPLSVLGFNKPAQRFGEFVAGFMLACGFATTQFVLTSVFSDFDWVLNPDYNATKLLDALRWTLNSVLYEELLFRGYLLYKAIERVGTRKACWLSAAAFGIYHWFSYGLFGSVIPMIYVFFLTGSFGLMLAYSFAMSKSVVLPIALHLGWNVVTILVFSNGPIGAQLLQPSAGEPLTMSSVQQLTINIVIPVSLVVSVVWVVTKKIRRYNEPMVETSANEVN